MTPHEEMKAHEKLCAERYSTIHKRLDRISPLAVPLVLEINRQTIDKSEVDEYFLEELENEILIEVGLS